MTGMLDWLICVLAILVGLGILGARSMPITVRYLAEACLVFWLCVIGLLSTIAGLWPGAVAATVLAVMQAFASLHSFRLRARLLRDYDRDHARP